MAITLASLTTGGSTANQNAYTSASISPNANRLILLATVSSPLVDVPSPQSPTVTGNGITWEKIDEVIFSPSASDFLSNMALYRAMSSGLSSGEVTMTWTTTQTGCSWSVVEFDGIDTSGTNGSGAIVQSANNRGTTETSLTVTLAPFRGDGNATYGAFGSEASASRTFTPGDDFTEIHDQAGGFKQCVQTEWRADNDTTVDTTISAAARGIAGIAIELKAASNRTTRFNNMNLTKYVLTGTTLSIDAKLFTYPISVTLTSSDAGRKIELSFDNGAIFHIPTYDFSTAGQLVVAIQVPFSDLKITGAAADTVWVAQGRQGVAA